MNREIKFRAFLIDLDGVWRKIEIGGERYALSFYSCKYRLEKLSKPFYDKETKRQSVRADNIDTDKVKISQYTGLKDKNGIEIYDGDIISTNNKHMIVAWNNYLAQFALRECRDRVKFTQNITVLNDYEVIDNIYENKELLKETQ